MAIQFFARIELIGNPDGAVYEKLHAHMLQRFWYQVINGNLNLPHATYQATFESVPDVVALANDLKASIQGSVWPRALVLVIQSANWAKSAG